VSVSEAPMQSEPTVTAVLVTLDEEENVEDCLASVRAAGVMTTIVVDASSTDRTVEFAERAGADVHVVPRQGLAYQRQYGVDLVRTPFVLMVDADNRFRHDTVALLVADLERTGMAGVAPRKMALAPQSYWARSWSHHNEIVYREPGPRQVIGTPALYRTAVLQQIRYDPDITTSSDDTDLCLRLERAGWSVGVGPAICDELVRESFRSFARKSIWYGRGDAEFFRKHPGRRLSIATHPLRNYLVRGSLRSLLSGRPSLIGFYLTFALLRSVGFVSTLLRWAVGGAAGVYRT
jgi:glycosyltransferase involved in cell wall biosynthesis